MTGRVGAKRSSVQRDRSNVNRLQFVTLEGELVILEPLYTDAAGDLISAATAGDQSTYGLTWVPLDETSMQHYVGQALREHKDGLALPYVIRTRNADQRIVGSARLCEFVYYGVKPPSLPEVNSVPAAAEVGNVWIAGPTQHQLFGLEAVFLLTTYAFEGLELKRVCFKTDARNDRSLDLLEKAGVHREGIRRAHMVDPSGGLRDSVYYSIVDSEWDQIRDALSPLFRGQRG